ncbi:MAG: alpha/beta hydrolase [Eubacterium sp.]|nr:alpha/beta hydrolase [Eubacterium sp.]
MKKIICTVLAFVMMLCSTSVAFAKNDVTPVIVMHGLGGADLYENVGTSEQKMLAQYGLDTSAMLKDEALVQEALKLLDNGRKVNYDRLFKHLGKVLKNSHINCTENGNQPKGQGILDYWETPLSKHPEYLTLRDFSIPVVARHVSDIIGKRNVYAFNYDWRLDVVSNAKHLRKLVVAVKKRTHAKKVTIVGLSLGGAVVSAYMDAYGNKKDVKKYVFIDAAFGGTSVARALEFDFQLQPKSVLTYLKHLETAFQGGAEKTTIRAIRALGDERIKTAVGKLNRNIAKNPKLRKKFYLQVVKPWMGNCPAVWECIPYSEFNKCVKTMSKIGFLDKKSGLYKKIKRYHAVQGRLKKNLKKVKKNGAEVVIIANYGIRALPLTSKKMQHTDLIIDTKYESAGATVATYGKKLKVKKGKYVSPDGIINASTCALPDNTWFFKNAAHGLFRYGTPASKFIACLVVNKDKCNIKAVKKKYGYSQFVRMDSEQRIYNIK